MSLFDDELPALAKNDDDRPDGGTVQALECYGYKPELVRKWSAARARATLRSERKKERITLRRAAERAAEVAPEDAGPLPERPPQPWDREDAASVIEQSMSRYDLPGAVAVGLYVLTDEELKQLAGLVVMQLRVSLEVPSRDVHG